MSPERNYEWLTKKIVDFLDSGENQGVLIHSLNGSKYHKGFIDNVFCLAAIPVEEDIAKLTLVTYGADKHSENSKFFRQILEIDFENQQTENWEPQSIDLAIEQCQNAFLNRSPIFTLSFGTYRANGERADFIHTLKGFSPDIVFTTFRRFAEMQLFGRELDF